MEHAISVRDVKKSYGALQALKGVTFDVPKGICFAVLGPNGAGKSTLLEIIEGVRAKDSGTITVLGLDLDEQKKAIQHKIGVQLQENNYIENLTLEDLLKFFLRMYGKKNASVESFLSKVDLIEKKKVLYEELSGGQKQRFSICASLVNDPEILFLDEPTTGLDPQNRQFIWDLIQGYKEQNKTVILTTHNMEEANKLADYVMVVDEGKIIASGTPDELKASLRGTVSVFIDFEKPMDAETILKFAGVNDCKPVVGKTAWRVWTTELIKMMHDVFSFAQKENITLNHLTVDQVTLEDVFLSLTGKGLRE